MRAFRVARSVAPACRSISHNNNFTPLARVTRVITPVRHVTTIQTHNGRVITPEKEISLTAQLIPQHVENFPFADARRFAQRITSGQFKGKLRILSPPCLIYI